MIFIVTEGGSVVTNGNQLKVNAGEQTVRKCPGVRVRRALLCVRRSVGRVDTRAFEQPSGAQPCLPSTHHRQVCQPRLELQ